MTILFAASEPGSARAILPIALACKQAGHPFLLVSRGHLEREATGRLPSAPWPGDAAMLAALLSESGTNAVVFSSNVKDEMPLLLARAAQDSGLPTIHVQDYWGNDLHRMTLDGGPPFRPDCYAVPDELAARMAIQEGVVPQTVVVTGHPAFGDTLTAFSSGTARAEEMCRTVGIARQKPLLLFASEPVAQDQGDTLDSPTYRGYVETQVLAGLVQTLKALSDPPQVLVLAHPRTSLEQITDLWRRVGGEKFGRAIAPAWGRELLPLACGVVGMASTLLYEAWLLGLPVASLQPGLLQEHLRMLKYREGVLFIEDQVALTTKLLPWLSLLGHATFSPRPELALHACSVQMILDLAQRLSANGAASRPAADERRKTS